MDQPTGSHETETDHNQRVRQNREYNNSKLNQQQKQLESFKVPLAQKNPPPLPLQSFSVY